MPNFSPGHDGDPRSPCKLTLLSLIPVEEAHSVIPNTYRVERSYRMEKPWLAFYDDSVPQTIDYPDHTLDAFLAQSAREYPDHTALIFFNNKLTYRQLDDAVNRLAAAFQNLGLQKGDRVSINMPNCPQYVISYYAALRAGGVIVPTNPTYTPRELHHQLNDSGATFVVTLTLNLGKVQEIRRKTNVRHVIATSIKEYFPLHTKVLFTLFKEKKEGHAADISGMTNTYWFQDLLDQHYSRDFSPVEISQDDLAVLAYTGGTTGRPKGAILLHRNLVANVLQTASWLPDIHRGEEVVLGALPFFHSYGMTVVMNVGIAIGGTIALVPDPRDLNRLLKTIDAHKPTLFHGVPTLYTAINNHPDIRKYDMSSIRYCISGAAGLPLEVQKQFEQLTGAKLVEGYGLTEAGPVTHSTPLEGMGKEGSMGIPFPDTLATIVDMETGHTLPPGEKGELFIAGPQIMSGYLNRPEETAKALTADENGRIWLHTGDVARMDEDGYFYIVDRKKDMILASGYNVYPREIEDVLFEHPKICEAAVIGVPHEYRGETVKAFIVPKENERPSDEEIISFCKERLAPYKVPKLIEFRESLPKSTVGKILRRELAEEEEQKQRKPA